MQNITQFNSGVGVVFYRNTERISGLSKTKAFEFLASFFGLWSDAGRGTTISKPASFTHQLLIVYRYSSFPACRIL
jgi:hypothetical protein